MPYNSSQFYIYIDERLNTLSLSVIRNGKLNMLNLHILSEDFYKRLLNLLYSLSLTNENNNNHNVEAIDLIDKNSGKVVQVSATCTREKVQSSLDKLTKEKHKGYTFQFFSIAKDADSLRKKTYIIPDFIKFDPKKDIYDVTSILAKVKSADTLLMGRVFELVSAELGSQSTSPQFESNIASIINVLSGENFTMVDSTFKVNKHDIDNKIEFNKLKSSRRVIEQYSLHCSKVDKIYTEFDKSGVNKSQSVLDLMESCYLSVVNEGIAKSPDDMFSIIVEKILDKVTASTNYKKMPIEELYLCVKVLVVDSFVRCKIFEDPTNYSYATA